VKLYDISRPLEPGVWTWPGDRPFETSRSWLQEQGATVNVGHLAMSCHTGTHMDAPFHYMGGAPTSETIDLAACIGPCVVTTLAALDNAAGAERVLIKAQGGAPRADQIERLAGGGLRLFGTDFHSVDPLDSTTLDAHHALWRKGAVILEELLLDGVPDGAYELVALPLRLVGMDATPVRAVLISR
jgi:arylformamidase